MARKKKEQIIIPQSPTEIYPRPIGEVTSEAYMDIGNYVNNHRHMAEVKDGCKVSYRRLIHSALQFPKGKLIPATKLISETSSTHPHSLSGIEGLNAVLVNSGVFTGEGSFGFTSITGESNPPASPRYLKDRLSDLYWDVLVDLMKYVPMVESPVGPLEPEYLPLPLPLCLRWDTKVRLTDGRDLTLKEITDEFNSGKTNYVLSCNVDGDFQVAKIINSCKTKTTNEYLRITLDNGEVINSTKDHLFMMRDGSYKKAEELVENDSLMPGYTTKTNDGRVKIKNNYSLTESFNRSIISIELISGGENEDFYDITVDSVHHNFLLSAGIVVHNCLILQSQVSGLGFGISTLYPNFSPKSLYAAYINNDPSLLEPNVDLDFDKKKSDLLGLWRYGKGKVTYSFHTTRVSDPATKREGVLFSGSTALFTPKLSKFKKLIEEGKVYMDDLTDFNGPKLFIGRVPGARGITIEDIWKIAEQIKSNTSTYVLNVTDSKMAYRIPLYDWLDYMYKNYIQLITYANNDKIGKITFDIEVQKAIPVVVDYITTKNPKAEDKEISKALGLSQEIVSAVMSKPISNLRKNKDTTEKVKALKAKLSELKKFNPIQFTQKIIQEL